MTPAELIAAWQETCARRGFVVRDFPPRLWDELATKIEAEYVAAKTKEKK